MSHSKSRLRPVLFLTGLIAAVSCVLLIGSADRASAAGVQCPTFQVPGQAV